MIPVTLVGGLVALAAAVYGFLGWATSAYCDTNCPSDAELAIYRILFFAGFAAFVVSVALLARALRQRRSRR